MNIRLMIRVGMGISGDLTANENLQARRGGYVRWGIFFGFAS